jgi:hypothetical protein
MSYLGNSNTLEIHDLDNTQTNCQIDEILPEHRIPLETISDVLEYIENRGYNGCRWCLEEYHTD